MDGVRDDCLMVGLKKTITVGAVFHELSWRSRRNKPSRSRLPRMRNQDSNPSTSSHVSMRTSAVRRVGGRNNMFAAAGGSAASACCGAAGALKWLRNLMI